MRPLPSAQGFLCFRAFARSGELTAVRSRSFPTSGLWKPTAAARAKPHGQTQVSSGSIHPDARTHKHAFLCRLCLTSGLVLLQVTHGNCCGCDEINSESFTKVLTLSHITNLSNTFVHLNKLPRPLQGSQKFSEGTSSPFSFKHSSITTFTMNSVVLLAH